MNPSVFLEGFGMSAGLIVAIGAQNAYVLRQGIRRQRMFLVAAFCAAMDAVLIAAGVGGLGTLINQLPWLLRGMTAVGSLFLAWYGVRSLRALLHPAVLETGTDDGGPGVPRDPVPVVLASLAAFTLLNPHVYLDTVVLLGSVGSRHPATDRPSFVLGACLASMTWFFGLAYGAGFLAPLFRRTVTWRVLDGLIAGIMFFMAYRLGLWALTGAG